LHLHWDVVLSMLLEINTVLSIDQSISESGLLEQLVRRRSLCMLRSANLFGFLL
jgi:hypothetical protein